MQQYWYASIPCDDLHARCIVPTPAGMSSSIIILHEVQDTALYMYTQLGHAHSDDEWRSVKITSRHAEV